MVPGESERGKGILYFSNITKVKYMMLIADFLKVNIKIAKRLSSIRGTRRFTKPSQTNDYLIF